MFRAVRLTAGTDIFPDLRSLVCFLAYIHRSAPPVLTLTWKPIYAIVSTRFHQCDLSVPLPLLPSFCYCRRCTIFALFIGLSTPHFRTSGGPFSLHQREKGSLNPAFFLLELGDDGVGVSRGRGLAAEVTGDGLALSNGREGGLLDAGSVLVETHVTEHHERREEESGGVGEALAGNVGSGAVDGLEDGGVATNVTRGGETETADEAGRQVGENVTVKVGHDHDAVSEGGGVLGDAEADTVKEVLVVGNVGVLLGNGAAGSEEHAVGHLHDVGLVDGGDALAARLLGVVEGVAGNTLRSLVGDKLDRLDDTVDDNVLDTRVLALSVLTDEDSVDVVVGGLEALDRDTGADVGEEVEGATEGEVERDVALADCSRGQWSSQALR